VSRSHGAAQAPFLPERNLAVGTVLTPSNAQFGHVSLWKSLLYSTPVLPAGTVARLCSGSRRTSG